MTTAEPIISEPEQRIMPQSSTKTKMILVGSEDKKGVPETVADAEKQLKDLGEITATYLHVRYGHSGADGLQRLESAVSSLA